MKEKENIYIDLSKCTDKEKENIENLTGYLPENKDFVLMFYYGEWDATTLYHKENIWIRGKTELTYPEFIKLFENGSLSLQTKLEMFYDFLYERGVAKQLGVGIDTIVKHFIDEKLLSNDR